MLGLILSIIRVNLSQLTTDTKYLFWCRMGWTPMSDGDRLLSAVAAQHRHIDLLSKSIDMLIASNACAVTTLIVIILADSPLFIIHNS